MSTREVDVVVVGGGIGGLSCAQARARCADHAACADEAHFAPGTLHETPVSGSGRVQYHQHLLFAGDELAQPLAPGVRLHSRVSEIKVDRRCVV